MSSSNGEHQRISMTEDSLSDDQGSVESSVPENQKKKKFSRKRIAFSVCLIIVAFTLIIIYLYGKTHVFDDSITSRLVGHSSLHREVCEDYEYGCCEIYTQCTIKHQGEMEYLDYKPNVIDVSRIHSHDILDSNCPSLKYLVNDYNRHYGKDDCGDFGCCPSFDVGCDSIIHNEKNNGGNSYLLEKYLENKNDIMEIRVPKENERGSNCWNMEWHNGVLEFIDSYEDGYPSKDDNSGWVIGGLFTIVVLWLFCESCK